MFVPTGYFAAVAAGGDIVLDNLEQWLKVESGTEVGTLADSSGNGRDANKTGGADVLYDTVNQWWDVTADSADDHIDSQYEPNWLGSWTIECWINMTSLSGGASSFVGNRETAGTNFWILAANENNGKIEIYWIGGGETAISPTPASSYFDSQWHHVVATHDSSTTTMRLYVDKTEVGSASTSGRTSPSSGHNLNLMGKYLSNRYWDDALFGSYRVYSADIGSAGVTQNYDAEKAHYGL